MQNEREKNQEKEYSCIESESESEVAQSCPTLYDPWTIAHQAPQSMGFSRQEYWSGLPFPEGYINDHYNSNSYNKITGLAVENHGY